MAIPLSYNVRNLRMRKSLTIMTALGIALTVATAVFIMALLAGLGRAIQPPLVPLADGGISGGVQQHAGIHG